MVLDTFKQALDKVKGVQVKSYGQLCSIARALDVVGDRWTLLIVRELLIGGALRFGEVQRGLPGIATNLLTQRLRDLETNGVVAREPAPGNPGTPTYRLTERGRALDGVLRDGRPVGDVIVRPDEPPIVIRFSTFDDGFDLTAADGTITVDPCRRDVSPLAGVTGPGPVLVALLQGAMPLPAAIAQGVDVTGDAAALTRVLPAPRASTNVPGQYN